jgi:antitoxin HicB
MKTYRFPAEFARAEEGGFVITFPDFPEAITQAESFEEGLEEAEDALDEAITGRINTGRSIPEPSGIRKGQVAIPVPAQTAFKAALWEEIHDLSKVEFAARLGIDEKEVRRLLDPHHPSKLPRIAEILERVGKRIVVQVQDEKEMAARA